jgi:CRP/FNR family cyclic AMP-dependent transcriptional regulator
MTDAQLNALAKYGQSLEFSPAQMIVQQGDHSNTLFLVLDGKVGAYIKESHGNEVHLRTIESGGHFGEVGLLDGGGRTANIRALSQCRLFSLDEKAFQELLKTPDLAAPLLHGLSRSLAIRLADVTNRMAQLWSLKDIWQV